MEFLSEVRNRNISTRVQEELDDWIRERQRDSFFVLVLHDQQRKQIHFTIGDNGIPFVLSYGSEPYTFSCDDDLMSQWVFESNRYSAEQNNITRSLYKSTIVYSILFPSPEVQAEVQQKRQLVEQQLLKIKEIPPPYRVTDIQNAALGCLLGGFVGEASGAALEMFHRDPSQEEVINALAMCGGGFHRVSPGQLTDDGELTLALAHVLIDNPTLNKIAQKYVDWLKSSPIDIGGTVFRSVGCHNLIEWKPKIQEQGLGLTLIECAKKRNSTSLSNGCLMRASAMGIWGHKLPVEQFQEFSFLETSLTNPHPITQQAVFIYRLAIAHLMNNPGDSQGAFEKAESWAKQNASTEVISWLETARNNLHCPYYPETGHIRIPFIHAFRHLLLQTDYYDALEETFFGGGDTDTNGIIIGALLGACYGVTRIPETMRQVVLECVTNQRGKRAPRPTWMLAGQVPQLVQELLNTAPDQIDIKFIIVT